MPDIAIVYHSGFGHTKVIAESIARGAAAVDGCTAKVISVDELPPANPQTRAYEDGRWAELDAAEAIIFGSPTYMGSVSAPFKAFMDASSGKWFTQAWRDKLAAGFTVSGSPSGDKLNTLHTLVTFAGQQSMLWVSTGVFGTETKDRLGSFLGMMAQADNAPADQTPPPEDHALAEAFGRRVATAAVRWAS